MNNYFNDEEKQCRCNCGKNNADKAFTDKLNEARELADTPFVINSWSRCDEHNRAVGGSKTSSHLLGCAVDIKTTSLEQRYKILTALIKVGFTRIGVAKTFIHVDSDITKTQHVFWLY